MTREIGQAHRDLFSSHEQIGTLAYKMKQYDEAHIHFASAHLLQERLSKNSKDIGSLRALAVSHSNLGLVLVREGKYPEALSRFESTLELIDEILSENVDDRAARQDYATALERAASALFAMGRPNEAVPRQKQVVESRQRFVLEAGEMPPAKLQQSFVMTLYKLGFMQLELAGQLESQAEKAAKLEAALATFEEAASVVGEIQRMHADKKGAVSKAQRIGGAFAGEDQGM